MRLLNRRRRTTRRLVGATVLAVVVAVGAHAGAAQSAPPTAATLKAWHAKVAKVPHPSAKGCFTAGYPRLVWHETTCAAPPSIPMVPKHGAQPLVMGNGNDIAAQAPSGLISEATGSFENVTNVTSVSSPIGNSGPAVSNAYTLQLNTDYFASPACAGSPNPGCRGWQQFLFANNGSIGAVYLQYWLIRYNTACPGGWFTFSFTGDPDVYCYRNSPVAAALSSQPIADLADLDLSGVAGATTDTVTLLVGSTAYSTSSPSYLDAAAGWTVAEFNVFGFGGNSNGGSAASFNVGASVDVRTRIDYGGNAAPICVAQGFTGETNNLNQGTPQPPASAPGPAVIFLENMSGGAVANCSAASVIGDTHQTTFSGLKYDFQASGDFVEAQVGNAFEVQTRKVSGAPNWPNASVNQSVGTRMGGTEVAICDRTRLVVDRRDVELPSGESLSLPSGVDIHHAGNVYFVSDDAGNSIRVTVNSTHINVVVGLGTWPAEVRGLLGNPDGDVNRLEARDGTQFTIPISFEDLYHRFGESWRVHPTKTLLASCDRVDPGTPGEPFFARDLDPDLRQRAETVCLHAEVTAEWLGACTLDVAVIGERAAAVYVGMAPPVLDGDRHDGWEPR